MHIEATSAGLSFSAWRIFLAFSHFARAEEVDRSALVMSLWKAAISGLLGAGGATHTHGLSRADGGRLAGAAMLLGVEVSSSDESDEEGELHGRRREMPCFAAAASAQQASSSYAVEQAAAAAHHARSPDGSTPDRHGPPSPLTMRLQSLGLWRKSVRTKIEL